MPDQFDPIEVPDPAPIAEAVAEAEEKGPGDVEQFPRRPEPTPVAVTSAIYETYAEQYGEEQAELLQKKWGDRALEFARLADAVLTDHPALDETYSQHALEDGSLPMEGVVAGLQQLMAASGFKSPEELSKAHPELDALFLDHFDQQRGTLSAVGVHEILRYVAQRSGYRWKR